jgi:hypothetical protein
VQGVSADRFFLCWTVTPLARKAAAKKTKTTLKANLGTDQDKLNEFGLTQKQYLFALAYVANGGNGTRAAETAKYEGDENVWGVVAYENLRNPKIKAFLATYYAGNGMAAEEAVSRLASHARGNLQEFVGLTVEEFKKHPLGWLVKKVEVDVAWPPKDNKNPDEPAKPYQYIKRIELHDPQAAINTILKQHQLVSGQPTEIISLMPDLDKLVGLLKAAGKDPSEVIRKLTTKLETDHG